MRRMRTVLVAAGSMLAIFLPMPSAFAVMDGSGSVCSVHGIDGMGGTDPGFLLNSVDFVGGAGVRVSFTWPGDYTVPAGKLLYVAEYGFYGGSYVGGVYTGGAFQVTAAAAYYGPGNVVTPSTWSNHAFPWGTTDSVDVFNGGSDQLGGPKAWAMVLAPEDATLSIANSTLLCGWGADLTTTTADGSCAGASFEVRDSAGDLQALSSEGDFTVDRGSYADDEAFTVHVVLPATQPAWRVASMPDVGDTPNWFESGLAAGTYDFADVLLMSGGVVDFATISISGISTGGTLTLCFSGIGPPPGGDSGSGSGCSRSAFTVNPASWLPALGGVLRCTAIALFVPSSGAWSGLQRAVSPATDKWPLGPAAVAMSAVTGPVEDLQAQVEAGTAPGDCAASDAPITDPFSITGGVQCTPHIDSAYLGWFRGMALLMLVIACAVHVRATVLAAARMRKEPEQLSLF